ncbi:zinc finger protein Dzip1 [Contarinia nasturtii]|uniref:zinc finger protein Dzip1 n=1 Tax=Contarinia nasturtii TaxID=265458 RepID=UPI0012D3AA77|nr:zinc finger protein Dzip1 [Contarinia nasturtii]
MFAFKEPLQNRPNNYRLSEIALKSGFKFRNIENRKLDWKALGCVDVNKVIENQDYEFLEKITPKIIEAPMQSILGTSAIDPAICSLFRLAQMSLQYMSFCQQFMSHTLYDLRTAFNQIQRKYSNLKQNYKCLEEQHYKAQERIQSLLREIKCQKTGPSSLYPCDECTKNFLTVDSLKSHQQRKHSVIAEKHELSDDNEKENYLTDNEELAEDTKPTNAHQTIQDDVISAEKEVSQLKNSNNNNNSDGNELNVNCTECSQKMKVNSSTKAVQCEESIFLNENNEAPFHSTHDEPKEKIDQIQGDGDTTGKKLENELIQSAYETISELKREIVDLKNSLGTKPCTDQAAQQTTSENLTSAKLAALTETNDKIDVIEQKFNAFEVMYTESQHQFIESFRNLDERQKVYMDNIQETIKDIVEKSLGKHDSTLINDEKINVDNETNSQSKIDAEIEETDLNSAIPESNDANSPVPSPKPSNIIQKATNKESPRKFQQSTIDDSASYSEEETTQFICQAEIHAPSQNESNLTDNEEVLKSVKKKNKTAKKRATKDVAINEFQQRLRQIGVEISETGLATPRTSEINQDLAEEREEIKKAHKSFESTRKKLRSDIEKIAKVRLASASSLTSLSSYRSDDEHNFNESDETKAQMRKTRPKSASVQQTRKRNAKKLMNKFVENDIDENDIIDKMQMAQKAINSHRECIQQLLQTTAHSPNSLTKLKYVSSTAPKNDGKHEKVGENNESAINQYNQMPNVTTRRVVFVNLDEDS